MSKIVKLKILFTILFFAYGKGIMAIIFVVFRNPCVCWEFIYKSSRKGLVTPNFN